MVKKAKVATKKAAKKIAVKDVDELEHEYQAYDPDSYEDVHDLIKEASKRPCWNCKHVHSDVYCFNCGAKCNEVLSSGNKTGSFLY